jgi:PncC family amidohydrolase
MSYRTLARVLKQTGFKVVFAESCTAGLVSALLARVPGISEYHCGGVVVYRNATKHKYLKISQNVLRNPGPVSERVAAEMAVQVLRRTPEADFSASVTGHLGPGAPPKLDGLVFIGRAERRGRSIHVEVETFRCQRSDSRTTRQRKVANRVLAALEECILQSQAGA